MQEEQEDLDETAGLTEATVRRAAITNCAIAIVLLRPIILASYVLFRPTM